MNATFPEKFPPYLLYEFDRCWDELKKKYSNQITKCKKAFAREVTLKTHWILSHPEVEKFYTKNPTISEILDFVFKAHLHYTASLTDYERARTQKDVQHMERIVQLYSDVLLWMSNRKESSSHIPYTLHYETIIHMCDFVLESMPADLDYELDDKSKERYLFMRKLYTSAFNKLKAVYDLFAKDFIEEAATLFRSLHELECVIIVLNQCKKRRVYETYTELLKCYNYAFYKKNKLIPDDKDKFDEEEQSFNEYKERLNIKKNIDPIDFINYGWLRTLEGHENDEPNGATLRKIAGQDHRKGAYSFACQFSHHSGVIYDFKRNHITSYLLQEIDITFGSIWNEWIEFKNFYYDKNEETEKLINSLVDMYNITNPHPSR